MMPTNIFAALSRATFYGLASGLLTGLALGVFGYLRALAHVKSLTPPASYSAGSIMCSAGSGLFYAPVIGGLLGVLTGLSFGLLFIAVRAVGVFGGRLP